MSKVCEVADEVVGQVQVGKRSQLGQTLHCNSQSGNQFELLLTVISSILLW